MSSIKHSLSLPSQYNILAIESSCDDTSVCVMTNSKDVLFEKTLSQDEVHEPYQGIVPNLAGMHHRRNLPKLLKEAREFPIHVLAGTRGPGLPASLSVGWNACKTLSAYLGLPCLPIHHMEGHALMPLYLLDDSVQFPFLSLLISGGHTLLVYVRDIGSYSILGSTLDDAVGEALDKGGRLLNLDWVNGSCYAAALEKKARLGNPSRFKFTLPLMKARSVLKASLNFSFSGIKTALKTAIENHKQQKDVTELSDADVCDFAASYQSVIVEHLCNRVFNSIEHCAKHSGSFKPLQGILVSGGVVKNELIRQRIIDTCKQCSNIPVYFPPFLYCTDNAVMIAWAALKRLSLSFPVHQDVGALDIKPVWSLEEIEDGLEIK